MSDLDPQTSAAIVRAGDTLGHDLRQELATIVGTTVARERLRRRVAAALGGASVVGGGALCVGPVVGGILTVPLVVYGLLCSLPILPMLLLWGVRNRALLDIAAKDAGVDGRLLVDACEMVRKQKIGPSTALRAAEQKRAKTETKALTTTTTTTTT